MVDGIRISLNEGALKDALSEAILAQLTGEMRNKIIKDAITYLTTQKSNSNFMGDRRSPLQVAFDHALETAAHSIARDYIEADSGFRTAVKEEIAKAAATVLTESERFRKVVSTAVVDAMMNLREENER